MRTVCRLSLILPLHVCTVRLGQYLLVWTVGLCTKQLAVVVALILSLWFTSLVTLIVAEISFIVIVFLMQLLKVLRCYAFLLQFQVLVSLSMFRLANMIALIQIGIAIITTSVRRNRIDISLRYFML